MEINNGYPQVPDGTCHQQRGKTHLLLHPDAPRWVLLNATGLEVAHLCDGQHSISQITAAIAQRWDKDPAVIQRDVVSCLDSLQHSGFLSNSLSSASQLELPKVGRPWRLYLYLTEQCNLRCRHCAVVHGPRPTHLLNSETIYRLIDQALETGVDGIAFSGGEPLLRDDLPDLLEYSARRVKTLLSTNGMLLDEPTAAALANLGVIVQISLDGATAATHDAIRGGGAFERTWQGIAELQRYDIGDRLALNVTLMRHNIEQMSEIIDLAVEHGVSGVRFTPLQPMGRAAELWSELAPTREQYVQAYRFLYQHSHDDGVVVSPGLLGLELEPPENGLWCGLGRLLLVDSQGDIYPCSMLTTPQFQLGNIADTPLAEALASKKLCGLVMLAERRKDEIEACRACGWRHFCQASCPASIWLQHGNWYATDGLCDLRQELFRDLIFERAEIRQRAAAIFGLCPRRWRGHYPAPDPRLGVRRF
ncbi:MAG: PqqD family peptide modification chaperone [Chloroflexi bacterium]|nr:PqqD family peptide modification chaperone [Chloroflexota bacterium]